MMRRKTRYIDWYDKEQAFIEWANKPMTPVAQIVAGAIFGVAYGILIWLAL